MVLKRNKFFVETSDPYVFDVLADDPAIRAARVNDEGARTTSTVRDRQQVIPLLQCQMSTSAAGHRKAARPHRSGVLTGQGGQQPTLAVSSS